MLSTLKAKSSSSPALSLVSKQPSATKLLTSGLPVPDGQYAPAVQGMLHETKCKLLKAEYVGCSVKSTMKFDKDLQRRLHAGAVMTMAVTPLKFYAGRCYMQAPSCTCLVYLLLKFS